MTTLAVGDMYSYSDERLHFVYFALALSIASTVVTSVCFVLRITSKLILFGPMGYFAAGHGASFVVIGALFLGIVCYVKWRDRISLVTILLSLISTALFISLVIA